MCTLVLAWRVFDGTPVVVAANRDEALDRPAEPPGVHREDPLVVAPRDVEAGGTWIGFNEYGLFSGVTNRWIDADLPSERSRGRLVADVLECESAAGAAALVEREVAENGYDGFNLVIADAADAILIEWDGVLERTAFEPGVRVVVNVGVDGRVGIPDDRPDAGRRQAESATAVRRALEPDLDEDVTAWLDRAGGVLGDHDYGVCVHDDGFGTRSSSLLAVGETTTYRYADGAPCETAFEPVALEGHI